MSYRYNLCLSECCPGISYTRTVLSCEVWAFSFYPLRPSSLSCMNELVSEWQVCQRVKRKALWAVQWTGYCAIFIHTVYKKRIVVCRFPYKFTYFPVLFSKQIHSASIFTADILQWVVWMNDSTDIIMCDCHHIMTLHYHAWANYCIWYCFKRSFKRLLHRCWVVVVALLLQCGHLCYLMSDTNQASCKLSHYIYFI